ncbi:MAG: hypothetical protein RR847_00800 [Bacilli bacterium]
MQKKIILMFLVLVLTGCTAVRIDTNSIDNTINVVLSKDNKLYNRVGKGYKYYVPRGVTYIDSNELNDKLYSGGNYYYLYVDAISYYYNIKPKYQKNKTAYYTKKIKIGDKQGFVEINKKRNQYYIEFIYNYAKIETIVAKEDVKNAILDASYILSTVKFNNNIIKLMLNEEIFTNREEKYNLFEPIEKTENFLEYVEENPKEEKNKR